MHYVSKYTHNRHGTGGEWSSMIIFKLFIMLYTCRKALQHCQSQIWPVKMFAPPPPRSLHRISAWLHGLAMHSNFYRLRSKKKEEKKNNFQTEWLLRKLRKYYFLQTHKFTWQQVYGSCVDFQKHATLTKLTTYEHEL